MKKISTILILQCFALPMMLMAQNPEQVEMADTMRSEGKIYVVVGVLLIIFLLIGFFLIAQERKINRIESDLKK